MPILYESYKPSTRVKDTELELTIFVQALISCPVCGATFTTIEERDAHIKSQHPLQWYFWYAPYGKPLLAFTGVSVTGLVIIGLSKALRKPPKK